MRSVLLIQVWLGRVSRDGAVGATSPEGPPAWVRTACLGLHQARREAEAGQVYGESTPKLALERQTES